MRISGGLFPVLLLIAGSLVSPSLFSLPYFTLPYFTLPYFTLPYAIFMPSAIVLPSAMALSTDDKNIFIVARDASASASNAAVSSAKAGKKKKSGNHKGRKGKKSKPKNSDVSVYVKRGNTFKPFFGFNPYGTNFSGGVRVAAADINGDGFLDIVTSPGPNSAGNSEVQVWTLKNLKRIKGASSRFSAFDAGFTGGVNVAAGDVNGDGVVDIITGTASGANLIRVFDGSSAARISEFFPYVQSFTGGVSVAAGDIDGDGRAEVITAPASNDLSLVRVYDAVTGQLISNQSVAQFFAYDTAFTGGVFVAAGDINADGKADIITGAGPGGGPHVKVFSGSDGTLLNSFFAFDTSFTGGVRVATGDFGGIGSLDIVAGTTSALNPHVRIFDGSSPSNPLASFFAFDSGFQGGVFVAGGP